MMLAKMVTLVPKKSPKHCIVILKLVGGHFTMIKISAKKKIDGGIFSVIFCKPVHSRPDVKFHCDLLSVFG